MNIKNLTAMNLILLAKQKNDETFNKYVRGLLREKMLNANISLKDLEKTFIKSKDLKRKILADVIAIKLLDEHIIDTSFVKFLFEELDEEAIWMLTNSKIEFIRNLAYEKIMEILRVYDELNEDLYLEKFELDELSR